jgi:hypothetical protein
VKKSQRSNSKLGAQNRTQAVAIGRTRGLIQKPHGRPRGAREHAGLEVSKRIAFIDALPCNAAPVRHSSWPEHCPVPGRVLELLEVIRTPSIEIPWFNDYKLKYSYLGRS